jgi:hypothetical protein
VKLLIVSHKPCWRSSASPSGFATDGGFPLQVRVLSQLFDTTTLLVPCAAAGGQSGEIALEGQALAVRPLGVPRGSGLRRKLAMAPWLAASFRTLWREVRRADAVHTPIPGDIGTIGMLLAFALRKPLFVRHCGNWLEPRTAAEHFWRWFMDRTAGGRNVMLATGGTGEPPSQNPSVQWIFSTSLSARELTACAGARKAPGAACRLIVVCRQEPEKGTAVVIDAVAAIRQRFPLTTLDVVGDGSHLPALRRLVDARGLSDAVLFHGKVDHSGVMRLLQGADLFCYPTRASEGFPKVVLEALACGLPVVTTRVSVLPQLLSKGGGVLLNEATPASLADAVCAILGSPSGYEAMSASAVRTAAGFSLECWADAIASQLEPAWGTLRAS